MWIFSIYNKLKIKKWQKLPLEKRRKVLENIEKKEAKKLGLKPVKIILHKDRNWECYGMYEYRNDKEHLVLNPKLLEVNELRFHAYETIVHETRHAYQHFLTTSTQIYWWNFKKKRWARNYAAYINSSEDSEFYNLQPIERDAQKYTISRFNRLQFRFRNEQDFFDTLARITSRFETSEQKAKEKHGIFYRFKLMRNLRKKENKKK